MKIFAFIVIFGVLPFVSFGQYSFSGSATGSITIGTINSLSFTNNAGNVSFNGVDQYSNGQTVSNCASVAIKSNIPWLLSFASNASLFTATGGGASTDMPASVVSLRVNGGSFKTMSTTSQTLATGNAGNISTTGNSFNLDMNINPGFGYTGGTYSLSVIYTLTNQ